VTLECGKQSKIEFHQVLPEGTVDMMPLRPAASSRGERVVFLGALALVSAAVLKNIHLGEFAPGDEGDHVCTALYMASLIRDLPLSHPVQYTYRYYAQYPALWIIHWPPLFHFVLGLMFIVTGASILVS